MRALMQRFLRLLEMGENCNTSPINDFKDWMGGSCCVGGSCDFCTYANDLTKSSKDDKPCHCTSDSIGESEWSNNKGTEGIVCFKNHRDVEDCLCIFSDYNRGRNNIEFMESKDLSRNLQNMLDAANSMKIVPEDVDRVCFHKPEYVSVAWTHGHFFKYKEDNINWPDGVSPANEYCVPDPFGKDAAKMLAELVRQK